MRFVWTVAPRARHSKPVLTLLALLAGWFAGVPSWAGVVRDVRVAPDAITLTFDDRVGGASAFEIVGPHRIAIDVNGAEPGGTTAIDGPVSGVRQGRQAGGARIVFDLSVPAIVTEGRFGEDGRTLTFALRTVDDATFARAAAERRLNILPPFGYVPAATRSAATTRVAVPPRAAPFVLPDVEGDPSRPLVVIDAGHGGHDPGAISPDGRLREKDLTLKVARAMRDRLLAGGKVRVALTRDTDEYLIHPDRYNIARRLGASLFISVHCDSAGNTQATGATAYTLSEVASDKEAARLAARENKADVIQGLDLGGEAADISSILIDLTQRETMNTSASFARLLGREATPADADQGGVPPHGVADRAEGPGHAVGAVRNRLYFESGRCRLPQFARWPRKGRREPGPRGGNPFRDTDGQPLTGRRIAAWRNPSSPVRPTC